MLGDKLAKAVEEFQAGKTVREVLFSDNPGIIPVVKFGPAKRAETKKAMEIQASGKPFLGLVYPPGATKTATQAWIMRGIKGKEVGRLRSAFRIR